MRTLYVLILSAFLACISISKLHGQTPGGVLGLDFWVKSDDAGTISTAWKDNSSNANDIPNVDGMTLSPADRAHNFYPYTRGYTTSKFFFATSAPNTVLTKSVSPANIPSGGTATYTFTLNNTTSGSVAQTNLSFTDNLPSGLRLAANPNVVVTGLTGGTVTAVGGGNVVTVSGYSQAASSTATITVDVTNMPGQGNASCGSNPAAFTNTAVNITNVSSNITNNVGNICLVVSPLPFDCNSQMYLIQNTNTGLYNILTSTNPFTFPIIGSAAAYQYNAAGFNPVDGYIYAMKTLSNNLLRIDLSGTITDMGAVTGLPAVTGTTNYNSGEIDHLGNYYIKASGANSTLYKVNINTQTASTIVLSQSSRPSDLAYSVTTGLLYGVDFDGTLFTINPSSGAVTFIGTSPGTATFGALFASSTGPIYGIDNAGGFFQFNLTTGARTLISDAPLSGNNDGAHCVTAPITFSADLSVTKTDNATTYTPGSSRVYTIVVKNNGPFGVLNASVLDNVPLGIPNANVSYTAVASAGSGTAVTGTQIGAINDLVSLPVNGTVTYTVTVLVPASFTGDLVNTVTISPPTNIVDPDLSNNQATDTDINGCTQPGVFDQPGEISKTGISDLEGFTGGTTGWPANVPNGFIVVESKKKGFVITRVSSSAAITDPKEGMLIYDLAANCVKLYNGTTWNCLTKSCL
ncbi:MAG: hypothetical protein P0Y49_15900 [Candidatus Pedobacter colombiensis]|uniref:DUF11 domain-containing protein n=1 Tax=Candidatus Pedobacter colombiensis TaxID=3121371 RepID=A0AAJ5W649_9SPHI|nr:hypothetical protein [Pedobacter sp.]WEK18275.1 MAG: hypothetical protein P0Y49_15900 [Pedobacter sp.]